MLKVDCLPNAVGKQPSIPLIYLGRKWTLNWWWWWIWVVSFRFFAYNCKSVYYLVGHKHSKWPKENNGLRRYSNSRQRILKSLSACIINYFSKKYKPFQLLRCPAFKLIYLSAPLRSNGADYVLLLIIYTFYFYSPFRFQKLLDLYSGFELTGVGGFKPPSSPVHSILFIPFQGPYSTIGLICRGSVELITSSSNYD